MTRVIPSAKPEVFAALGKVNVYFAALESQIEFLTWSLINSEQMIGQIITSELSFKGKVNLLSSIFIYRVENEEHQDELDAILTKAIQVEERRNVVVHSQWLGGGPGPNHLRIKKTAKKGKGIKHQFVHVSTEEIEGIADDASLVAGDLQDFLVKIHMPNPDMKTTEK